MPGLQLQRGSRGHLRCVGWRSKVEVLRLVDEALGGPRGVWGGPLWSVRAAGRWAAGALPRRWCLWVLLCGPVVLPLLQCRKLLAGCLGCHQGLASVGTVTELDSGTLRCGRCRRCGAQALLPWLPELSVSPFFPFFT